jgi:hypothetical protein
MLESTRTTGDSIQAKGGLRFQAIFFEPPRLSGAGGARGVARALNSGDGGRGEPTVRQLFIRPDLTGPCFRVTAGRPNNRTSASSSSRVSVAATRGQGTLSVPCFLVRSGQERGQRIRPTTQKQTYPRVAPRVAGGAPRLRAARAAATAEMTRTSRGGRGPGEATAGCLARPARARRWDVKSGGLLLDGSASAPVATCELRQSAGCGDRTPESPSLQVPFALALYWGCTTRLQLAHWHDTLLVLYKPCHSVSQSVSQSPFAGTGTPR